MRSERSSSWIASGSVALAMGFAIGVVANASSASAGTTLTRPIGDWVAAQGSCTSVPSSFGANYVSWTGRRIQPNGDVDRLATMDYAGVDARSIPTLPTRITGTVIERALADGGTLVKVKVVARDALAYAGEFDASTGAAGPVLFGTTPADVLAGTEPALGNCTLEVEYVVGRAPGGPMEDVFAASFFDPTDPSWSCTPAPPPLELRLLSFAGNADGECRDGSASRLSVVQTGLIGAGIHNGFQGALGDAFPAEWVELRPECN